MDLGSADDLRGSAGICGVSTRQVRVPCLSLPCPSSVHLEDGWQQDEVVWFSWVHPDWVTPGCYFYLSFYWNIDFNDWFTQDICSTAKCDLHLTGNRISISYFAVKTSWFQWFFPASLSSWLGLTSPESRVLSGIFIDRETLEIWVDWLISPKYKLYANIDSVIPFSFVCSNPAFIIAHGC